MLDFEIKVNSLLEKVAALLTARNWRMATAESCTGGRIVDAMLEQITRKSCCECWRGIAA